MMGRLTAIGVAVVLIGSVGCGGGGEPSLTRDWIDQTSDTGAVGLTFRGDGTYSAEVIVVVSTFSGGATIDAQVETGTYTAMNGTIDFVPRTYTCPGSDPVYSLGYRFADGNLLIQSPSLNLVFAPNNAMTTANVTAILGCFDSNGAFTVGTTNQVSN